MCVCVNLELVPRVLSLLEIENGYPVPIPVPVPVPMGPVEVPECGRKVMVLAVIEKLDDG